MARVLSICIAVKNRSRVAVDGHNLMLLPNCIQSIASAAGSNLACEIVVADWNSDDWPLEEWLLEAAAPLPAKIISLDGTFSRGRGLNAAARSACGGTLFFLDADMLVSPRSIEAGTDAVSSGKAFFPVVFAYDSPEHRGGWWREYGYGNCMLSRQSFEATTGWPELRSWGAEDRQFRAKVASVQEVVRNRVPGLFHQWHPNNIAWKNRFGEPIPCPHDANS